MIVDNLKSQLLTSLKAGDSFRTGVIRYLLSAVKNKEIELRPQGIDINDGHVLKVIKKQIKQREDTIFEFQKGKRQDLVDRESKEKIILEELFKQYGGEEAVAKS